MAPIAGPSGAQSATVGSARASGAGLRRRAQQPDGGAETADLAGHGGQVALSRFLKARLEGLYDEPRPGAPRKISDAEVERVVIQTLESTPRGETHWSTRGLAKASGLSRMTISRVWRAFGLQPHDSDNFKLSRYPLLIEKVRDIVGLYMNPPDHALVLCVDEKSQIQALDRTQPLVPMWPGQLERRTHDYKRHGTTSLFAALELKTNKVIAQLQHHHRSLEFRQFLDVIEAQVPTGLEAHIIVDNYGTHKTALIRKWFAKRPRFHLHFTPTYGSWINLVERWFAELTNKRGVRPCLSQVVGYRGWPSL